MQIPLYQVNAFTSRHFGGNPAAVCLLEEWLDDAVLQKIAAENNKPATSFLVPMASGYDIRWFLPTQEINLCGHATLAAAYVAWHLHSSKTNRLLNFRTRSGPITATKHNELIELDLPIRIADPCQSPDALLEGLGHQPEKVLAYKDKHGLGNFLAIYECEEIVRGLKPTWNQLAKLTGMGVIVSAPGDEVDFVSRYFAPGYGIPEDHVTGSAHCTLVPYWANEIRQHKLKARQLSKRGGELYCELQKDSVKLAGQAVLFLKGTIEVPVT